MNLAKGPTAMKLAAAILFFITVCGSCVSVSLGGHEVSHAKGVSYSEPGSPFKSEKREDVDGAWKNKSNGDMISFFTDCGDDTDPSLETIVQGALQGLNDLKIESSQDVMIQSRAGRRVGASGKVDGVASKIDLLVFKRNRCIYLLSYVGVAQSFQDNHPAFEHFLASFRAP